MCELGNMWEHKHRARGSPAAHRFGAQGRHVSTPNLAQQRKKREDFGGFLESSRNLLVPIYCTSDLLRHSFRRTVLSLQLLWTHEAMYQDDIRRFGYTLFHIMLQKTTMTVDKPLHPS